MREIILEARNLQVLRNGQTILNIPKLQVETGEALAFLGPNGAGKTTLLQALALLQRPQEGEILLDGTLVNYGKNLLKLRRSLAVAFQEPLLFDTTVFENVASGLKLRGEPRNEIKRKVFTWLEHLGISQLTNRSARTLSGGEAQRTSLARAFVLSPQILFLDEPFAALDPPSREALIEDVERILQETRTTTILVTHDRTEALRLANRVAIMSYGKILQIGKTDEVFNYPLNETVAAFVGIETVLPGRVKEGKEGTFRVELSQGQSLEVTGNLAVGEDVLLCLRPEHVTLEIPEREKIISSARNHVEGHILKIIPQDLYYKVVLDCGFLLTSFVTKGSVQALNLQEGKSVIATFKATAVHIIRKSTTRGIKEICTNSFGR
ncbi:MAG: ABC transporter ATP-binding protein [Nitrospira sp.]|nr:ABC transporter ATP-binding protein [Nitrospira sp.]